MKALCLWRSWMQWIVLCVSVIALTSQASPAGSSSPVSHKNSLGMTFVRIEAGSFLQGAPSSDPDFDVDEARREVTISQPFYLQTTEVTQGQWLSLMGVNPSAFSSCGPDCPVERVNYEMIQVFIDKLNQLDPKASYRLPTEAEWEYAARAGTSSPFNTGDCLSESQANTNGKAVRKGCELFERSQGPVAVGSYPPNGWGLHDMHGNVWELCEDWYGPYSSGSAVDPKGPQSAQYIVLRGGSWRFYPTFSRSANRLKAFRNIGGFRLVRVAAPPA
ncbi:formylglycine-generating enzyme family protein [Pseudomaricurvus sp.]|uniref:formylglycine-generating enzyme family protein n=1 Tax=Pseudomaricurvus sp. TaxID=2004510 RepID=UPI003F6B7FB3